MPHIVDIRDWLDENGELPLALPVRRRALRLAQLIEAGGPLEVSQIRETLVACSSRLQRKSCAGLLWVEKARDERIYVVLHAVSAREIFISGWQDTIWANGPMDPVVRERSVAPAQIFN